MASFPHPNPLTRAELSRLGAFLNSCEGDSTMNLEELDGFFAALIAGPESVMPSEYLPEVFGGELDESCEFESIEEANEILGLLNRHWNAIAATLYKGEVYIPLLLKDENGSLHGNDWARGFIRGTFMRCDGWVDLVKHEENGGYLVPMMMLYHEHDEDPKMRPNPITSKMREEIVAGMAAGLVGAYQYFRDRRQYEITSVHEPRRGTAKLGRNEPCPCGSGKKYKKCCGGAVVE